MKNLSKLLLILPAFLYCSCTTQQCSTCDVPHSSDDSGIYTQQEITTRGDISDLYINDAYFRDYACNAFIKMLNQKQNNLFKQDIVQQTQAYKSCKLNLTTKISEKEPEDLYQHLSESTVSIFALFPCPNPKCSWHIAGISTGFFLTETGYVATNYHVTQLKGKAEVLGVMTRDGQCYFIEEIVANDPIHDIAIFKLKNPKNHVFKPLPLKPNSPVGTELNLVAHPSGNFYLMTKGIFSRRCKWVRTSSADQDESKEKQPKFIYCDSIMTDVEYAGGSSGGALCDNMGNVIGMVSSIRPIFSPGKEPQFNFQQMSLHFSVPVEKIIELISKEQK